jgi:DNA-binding NarL/FixJ family response regulator
LQDAIELVKTAPDLVLLDLGLPDGSGLEVIEALKKNDINSKVLVVTIFEDKASVLKTLRAGADGYILKDTPKDGILDELR